MKAIIVVFYYIYPLSFNNSSVNCVHPWFQRTLGQIGSKRLVFAELIVVLLTSFIALIASDSFRRLYRMLFVCLLSVVDEMISLTAGMHIIFPDHIIFSTFPSRLCECWWVQDSQRFVSVTLSNSDISLTTPRTGKHVHSLVRAGALSVSRARTDARKHAAFISLPDSPLLSSSQTCQRWHPEPNIALNQYQQKWLRRLSLC